MKAIKIGFAALLLLLAGGVAFLVIRRPPPEARGSEVIVGIQQEPHTLFPGMDSMFAQTEINYLTHAWLVYMDDEWELHPGTCQEIPTLENGLWRVEADAGGEVVSMEVTWKLRPDVRWADGEPVTAADYIFAQEVYLHPEVKVVSRWVEEKIERMTAPDPYTLVVTWKEPYAYANCFGLIAHPVFPKHLLEQAFRDNPAALNEHVYARNPVGNGPYRLAEWSPGTSLTLERNPFWYGETPHLERVRYRFIPKTQTLISDLEAGTIDAISPVGASFDQIEELRKRQEKVADRGIPAGRPGGGVLVATPPIRTYSRPGLVWEHIDFNLDDPILADPRVRHALIHAIDRETLVQELFGGQQPVAHSWLPPKHYGYNPDVKRYRYDPAAAAALLEEAEWRQEGPGQVRTREGKPLELIFMTTAGNSMRERVQQILQAQWKEVGVRVVIKNQPADVYFGTTLRHRDFPHLAMYAWVFGPISDGVDAWVSDKIPTAENAWTGQNNPGLRDAEIDRLDLLVPRTLDQEKRAELLRQEQARWVELLPAIPLYFRADVSAARSELQEWKPTGHQVPVTWNAPRWQRAGSGAAE